MIQSDKSILEEINRIKKEIEKCKEELKAVQNERKNNLNFVAYSNSDNIVYSNNQHCL